MYAAHCGGRAPIGVGWTPSPSTSAGTSTQASPARLAISAPPSFITLATIRAGSPVAIALTITAAYSPLRSISNGSPASSIRLVSAYSSRLFATRVRYSPIGTWNGSTWPLGMNHGLYSAWCSDDSVG